MSRNRNNGRRAARAQAFQVLYSLSFADISGEEDVRRAFRLFPAPPAPDGSTDEAPQAEEGFAWELVYGVWLKNADLDELISRFSRNWRVDRLGRVERTLLRLALYEMLYRQDVPAKVAINEALELTRQFGEDNAVSFVNGVLDAAAKAIEDGALAGLSASPPGDAGEAVAARRAVNPGKPSGKAASLRDMAKSLPCGRLRTPPLQKTYESGFISPAQLKRNSKHHEPRTLQSPGYRT